MSDHNRSFQVGDQVIHWVYGLGEIIQLDEKVLSGQAGRYYVVQTDDLTLWVPLNEMGERRLRFLTPPQEFPKLFGLLASPGESLPPDRFVRKTQLTELLREGSLESICRVIRDLICHKRNHRVNESDNAILERAKLFLLNEWSAALSIPIQQADRELTGLLERSVV